MPTHSANEDPEQSSTHWLSLILKSGGDPLRLQILRALNSDSFGVLELSHIFSVKQSGMSHHLKVMANAGLVTTRREGNSIFYRRSNAAGAQDGFIALREALFNAVDELLLTADTNSRIQEIHRRRSQTSQQFFNEQGTNLKEKQDLIAEFAVYGEQVQKILQLRGARASQTALEIGPGEGEFLPVLAAHFERVVALDNSQIMLDKSRAWCQKNGLANVEFHLADTQYCRQKPRYFDVIVINMVLHHTPSPQQIFADISASLADGGALIVSELCPHNQDWARETCGDLWLGFDPRELAQWARKNQLTEGQSDYIALRNGFQIQIHEFIN